MITSILHSEFIQTTAETFPTDTASSKSAIKDNKATS